MSLKRERSVHWLSPTLRVGVMLAFLEPMPSVSRTTGRSGDRQPLTRLAPGGTSLPGDH